MGGEIQRGSLTHDMGYSLKAHCIGKQTTAAATAQESSESLHTCSSHFQPSKRTNNNTTFTPPQTLRLFNEGGGYSFRAQQSTPNQSKQQHDSTRKHTQQHKAHKNTPKQQKRPNLRQHRLKSLKLTKTQYNTHACW